MYACRHVLYVCMHACAYLCEKRLKLKGSRPRSRNCESVYACMHVLYVCMHACMYVCEKRLKFEGLKAEVEEL